MLGQMMNTPLTITEIMQHADKVNGDTEVVSVTADNPLHRYTLKDAFTRVRQLANALHEGGIKQGQRVATFAWSDYRHLELYYAVSCSGAVLHTVNPRLFPEQIEYIVNHAEDEIIFFDPLFTPLIESLLDKMPTVKQYIVLTDAPHKPDSKIPDLIDYETYIKGHSATFDWPQLDEEQASSMCYTSGTTGNPKGVVYSHRSTVLHSFASALPDALSLSMTETVMPIVPMFHVNCWGLAYSAPMTGTKLVLPGPKMADGEKLTQLINGEGVTISAGVPVVWLALLNYLKSSGNKVPTLSRIVVAGSACPELLMREFDELYDVTVHHAWGMTETSPVGTVNHLKPKFKISDDPLHSKSNMHDEDNMHTKLKQGRPVFGIDIRIENDAGEELPWDGKQFGSLKVRGPWVASGYYQKESRQESHQESRQEDDQKNGTKNPVDANGYFETGDVATIDSDGYMNITDRVKDVIKSGGEWISSIELENIAVGHPKVKEAAVIGLPHSKWGERPLLLVVADSEFEKQELLDYFVGKVAKFSLPDAVEFVEELPHTATGKLSKKDLRLAFADYRLEGSKS